MDQISPNALLHAVGIKLNEARAEIAQLRERIDDYGNVIRQPGPAGRDGIDGKDGLHGLDGVNGRDGIDGPVGRDGRDGVAGRDGERGEKGEKGETGERGESGTAGAPGERGLMGEPGERGPAGYVGEARGLWSAEAIGYRAMDVVSYNGSEWRAIKDDPGPLPGPGWMLGAKGIRGKPGERGAKGDRGEPGPAGASIEEVVASDYTLVFICSDGVALKCDLLPILERYREETS